MTNPHSQLDDILNGLLIAAAALLLIVAQVDLGHDAAPATVTAAPAAQALQVAAASASLPR